MSVSIAEKSNPVSKLKWEKSDSVWTMGLYATAVGAGTLFLPITVGSNSPVILLFILLLAFPLREFNFEVRHSPMPPDGTLRIP
ncbi:hypothetical protein ACLHZT_18705 [Aeromonas veronii]|uniref:hypothetical protein n=1 Tax=Aeromonas veronii TaxID=654 RepID=UPI003D068F68